MSAPPAVPLHLAGGWPVRPKVNCESFSLLAEPGLDQFKKGFKIFMWNQWGWVNVDHQDGRVYIWGREEGVGRDVSFDMRLSIHLHA